MAINTPFGDGLDGYLDNLLAGRSAITRWQNLDTTRIYTKIGADLSGYDIAAKLSTLGDDVPAPVRARLRKRLSRAAWSTRLSMLLAVDGYRDAGLFDTAVAPERTAVLIAGHNINANYQHENRVQFEDEPDYIDPMLSLHGLDTDHAGCVSEVLGTRGPIYTVGAACASGNVALRCAVDEIRYHHVEAAVVVGAVFDFSPVELHAMALMGAVSIQSFNDEPHKASRPFDARREGFVPAHGGGVLVLEDLAAALRRGARVYAELVGVDANSDANHLPQPSEEGQARLITRVLRQHGIAPEEIDYVNAHATSTPLGDLTEIRSIKRALGAHATRVKINAAKSMLGHTGFAAPIVETIAAVLQMNAGRLHPTINIDELDPEVDLDVCAGTTAVDYPVRTILKNSWGFGGVNAVSILRGFEGAS